LSGAQGHGDGTADGTCDRRLPCHGLWESTADGTRDVSGDCEAESLDVNVGNPMINLPCWDGLFHENVDFG